MAKPYRGSAYCSCCHTPAQSRKQATEWFKHMERFLDLAGRGTISKGFLCTKCRNGIAAVAVSTFDGMKGRYESLGHPWTE